jgi:multiple sugar transport system permease protein
MFRYITWPLILPYVMIALVIRTIDSLKVFDTIAVISQGGPGTASETLNYFLYLQAFQFYNVGYASAVVLVFFVIIIALSLLLLYARQQTKWME